MPSINDMMEVVDLLKVKAVEVDELKCVAVRNRNSKCRRCAEACIADAITVNHNEVAVDSLACVNCGCCVAVCPDDAIRTIEPAASVTDKAVARTADPASGLAVVACERKAARREGDPEKHATVPCLGYLSEEQLVSYAAAGFDDIVLVDGDCATCKYGPASPFIEAVVDEAAKIVEASGAEAVITRTSEFPPEVLDRTGANRRGRDRRGLMRQTGSYVKTVAGNVAMKTLDEKLGSAKKEPLKLRDRLHAGKSGKIPPFQPAENYRILDAMTALGAQDALEENVREAGAAEPASTPDVLDGRHFGVVSVDPERCSGCGMCVLFCPTEALKYAKYDEPADPDRTYLEFQAADCTQCRLCKDVCLRYCIEVDSCVPLQELFDFEPRLIEIARPQNKTDLLNLRERNKKRP